ncbi:ABC-2 type transporter protein [Tenacibaculum sp. 190130A14a]|uniref:ABC-2 type transporter protein n=1 Tax=Tenacibaculum polynesiense TaxID=3137857 RepID=A0ABP1F5N5_9FLAO
MSFIKTIKYDYLQRTRSYAFLITLCASLAIGYTFVPEPNANYSTIRIDDYVGVYNAAWFGYVTAIMTSIFLSLIGFYLVNSGIKKDIDTKVGQIIAATQLSNFLYILSKAISNFLILLTIVGVVFIMSIALFFLYNDGGAFEIWKFVKPYLLIPIPAMFLVGVIAVCFEIILRKYTVLQNVIYFFLFSFLMIPQATTEAEFATDVFGSKIVIHQLEQKVRNIKGLEQDIDMTVGYVLGNTTKAKTFEFNGIDFPKSFILSRIVWILLGLIIMTMVTPLFHRFSFKKVNSKAKIKIRLDSKGMKDINLSLLPKVQNNFGIFPLVKTELLLLIRNGSKWLWFLNIIGMIFLTTLPVSISHQFVLPILWFFQVSRLSNLTSKEINNNIHYFAFASFKPIQRVLTSQILSAFLLMLFLATPLFIRLGIQTNFLSIISVSLGAFFIVLLASVFGILTKGKKLFEVVFFLITYANINSIPITNYFGFLEVSNQFFSTILICICSLLILIYLSRIYQLRKA